MNPWFSNYRSKQGTVGLGEAISYYTSLGFTVSLPLNDTQPYDLVIEKDNKLQKVSVKTTQQLNRSKKNFVVTLRNSGGASGKRIIRKFKNTTCDILFVYTVDDVRYEIPSNLIKVTNYLTLTKDWDKYIVKKNIIKNHP